MSACNRRYDGIHEVSHDDPLIAIQPAISFASNNGFDFWSQLVSREFNKS
jgi:hypothetical protein